MSLVARASNSAQYGIASFVALSVITIPASLLSDSSILSEVGSLLAAKLTPGTSNKIADPGLKPFALFISVTSIGFSVALVGIHASCKLSRRPFLSVVFSSTVNASLGHGSRHSIEGVEHKGSVIFSAESFELHATTPTLNTMQTRIFLIFVPWVGDRIQTDCSPPCAFGSLRFLL